MALVNAPKFVFMAALLLCSGACSGSARAQSAQPEKPEKEVAVIELGGAVSRSVAGGGSSFGVDAAVEVTPIEHWLELEGGVTPLFRRGVREWDADLLFKKPWTLSKRAEFMIGAGPEWIHTNEFGAATNSAGVNAVLDFMFWTGGKHRFGWFLEPGYDYSFGRGHEQSVGIGGGLLIAIP